ncbi:Redox-sensing transcriptional repressor rex [Mycobacteroides abscessus subsp. abscessus]|nr:Redox-sensing transcriptional repressor rex [Mycobacteroides abscessus subsp. abscessus]
MGKRGYGYDVVDLLNFFKKILNQDRLTNVGLVGVGNLGHALLNYNFRQANNIRISAGFDINPELAGTIQSGVPIYPMDEMIKQIKDLNFTPIRISVPSYVRVQNVDLATELQTLIYFLEHYGPTLKEPEA